MNEIKKTIKKLISLNIPSELHDYLKDLCADRGVTLTWYITSAIVHKVQLETNEKYDKKFNRLK